jgi:hypothetical protein
MRNNNIHINIIYHNINKKQEQKMLHHYLKKQKQEPEPEARAKARTGARRSLTEYFWWPC